MREFDWTRTSLGPIATWPQSLRTAVDVVLQSPVPLVMLWGPEGIMIYNDAYSVFAGGRHPRLLGSPVLEGWPEVAGFNANVMEKGLRGETLSYHDQHLVLYRHGHPEDVWMDLNYSPLLDESGNPAGVLAIVVETTERVRARQALKESEAHTRQILDSATDYAIIATDLDRRVRTWSEGAHRTFGWTAEEMRGQSADRIFTPEDIAAGIPEAEANRALKGVIAPDERWHVRKDGQRFWAIGEMTALRDASGAASGLLKILRDRTDQRRSEDALRRSEAARQDAAEALARQIASERDRLQTLFDQAPSFMAVLREPSHVFELANAAYLRLIGRRDVIGKPVAVALPEVAGQGFVELLDKVYTTGEPYIGRAVRVLLQPSPGAQAEEHYLNFVYQPIKNLDGKTGGIFVEGNDVTDRVRAEQRQIALIELGDRLRDLADPADIAGVTAEILGRTLGGIRAGYATVDRSGEYATVQRDWTKGCAVSVVGRHRLADYGAEFLGSLQRGEIVAVSDVTTDQRTAEGAASWTQLGVRSFVNAPLIQHGRLSAFLLINDSVVRTWSEDELGFVRDVADRTWAAAEKARAVAALQELNASLEQQVEERTARLRENEEALRQAQKMEAVGQLTGGIAHDFNNLLTGIIGSLDLMQTRLAQGRTEGIERYAKAAMSSANRAAALTHRLLAFARRQPLDPKPVNVNQLIASMEDLLRRTLGESIAVELVIAGGLWTTRCDPNQLESAILNLVINARDAMPNGGKLTIETANSHLDNAYAAAERDVTPGQYVAICVTDTGTGMTPDVLARAFDPFFTTKPLGQGTGLGLSMVYGFAKQSEGHVRIYSEVGKGTTVRIYLPRYRGAPDQEAVSRALTEEAKVEPGQTVLVVEDDPVVRNLIIEVLMELGCRTLEAADGLAGLRILQSSRQIDLLITDVGLPGLNGRQLADQARETRPDLKVLFITGYAENAAISHGFLEPGMRMMTKPFAVEALAIRIREMTDSAEE